MLFWSWFTQDTVYGSCKNWKQSWINGSDYSVPSDKWRICKFSEENSQPENKGIWSQGWCRVDRQHTVFQDSGWKGRSWSNRNQHIEIQDHQWIDQENRQAWCFYNFRVSFKRYASRKLSLQQGNGKPEKTSKVKGKARSFHSWTEEWNPCTACKHGTAGWREIVKCCGWKIEHLLSR